MFNSLIITINDLSELKDIRHTPDLLLLDKQPVTDISSEHKCFTFKMSDKYDEYVIDDIQHILSNELNESEQTFPVTPEDQYILDQLMLLRHSGQSVSTNPCPLTPPMDQNIDLLNESPLLDLDDLDDLGALAESGTQPPAQTPTTPIVSNVEAIECDYSPASSETSGTLAVMDTQFSGMGITSPQPFSPSSDHDFNASLSPISPLQTVGPRARGQSEPTPYDQLPESSASGGRLPAHQYPYRGCITDPLPLSLPPFEESFGSSSAHSSSASQITSFGQSMNCIESMSQFNHFHCHPSQRNRSTSDPHVSAPSHPRSTRGRPCKRVPGSRGPPRAQEKRDKEDKPLREEEHKLRQNTQRVNQLESAINRLRRMAERLGLHLQSRQFILSSASTPNPNAPTIMTNKSQHQYYSNAQLNNQSHNAMPSVTMPNPNAIQSITMPNPNSMPSTTIAAYNAMQSTPMPNPNAMTSMANSIAIGSAPIPSSNPYTVTHYRQSVNMPHNYQNLSLHPLRGQYTHPQHNVHNVGNIGAPVAGPSGLSYYSRVGQQSQDSHMQRTDNISHMSVQYSPNTTTQPEPQSDPNSNFDEQTSLQSNYSWSPYMPHQ